MSNFAARARRPNPAKIARILKRVGKGNAPVEGMSVHQSSQLSGKRERAEARQFWGQAGRGWI